MKDAAFAKALKSARKKRGWTRIQVYMKSLELSKNGTEVFGFSCIEKWENGRELPGLKPTVAFSRLYQMPELIQLRIKAVELSKRKNPHELALTWI
jgi:hypothetical protein